jgi:radical SAM protein with 4Fe4S-binding SPASM domain
MTLTRKNVDQVENMIDFLKKKLNIKNLKINPVMPTGRAAKIKDKEIFFNAKELYQVSQDIHALSESLKFPILLHLPPAFRPLSDVTKKLCGGNCSFPNLLGVLANGDISFCGVGYTRPEYIFGSILDENYDLKNIWDTNEVLKFVRESIPHQLKGVCGKCIHKNGCRGECRVFADQIFNSLDSPFPYCQELYDSGNFPQTRLI